MTNPSYRGMKYPTTRDRVDVLLVGAVILALVVCVIWLGITGHMPF
jgi:hypothetical protein